ncbi:MAG: cupredoxin domain-containing protein [Elusimicrobia bacterium]|nr:cupredoxin domain-containing protein [Elusimicrobiota bacterium]
MKKFGIIVIILLSCFLTSNRVIAEMHHHEGSGEQKNKQEKKSAKKSPEKNVGVCPVMPNEKASEKNSYIYKNKTYYFCCPDCLGKFKSDPEKYISKIKDINLEAYQYGFSPDIIVVKKGDIVKLTVTSRDVPHGVCIKNYGIKVVVKKGEYKKIEFFADKSGKFDIICSVYCGEGHSKMKSKLIVEE